LLILKLDYWGLFSRLTIIYWGLGKKFMQSEKKEFGIGYASKVSPE
jgi:hypothetical protein